MAKTKNELKIGREPMSKYPLYLMADIFVVEPSLMEIAIALMNMSRIFVV
jgi:hypothetical protein